MLILLTLASGQFLMKLDSSVMNVSIATVAKDVGTTVTGIPGSDHRLHARHGRVDDHGGAKIGAIIGRKKAFAIGCVSGADATQFVGALVSPRQRA
jgi:hypothetical protein